jgi:nucleoside-diphosphate-sugar epimerase
VPRFLYSSSSCSSYGKAGDALVDETAELRPITAYAISKVRAEQDVARLADDRFSPTFFRNATAYGVSPRLRFDLVLSNLTAWVYAKGRVHIKSDSGPPTVEVGLARMREARPPRSA